MRLGLVVKADEVVETIAAVNDVPSNQTPDITDS
jgi:hypothetical protein